jgi:hypothetical protein
MIWRRGQQTGQSDTVVGPDPVVYDVNGLPVGVRLAAVEQHDEETVASRQLARMTALRKTRELEGRHWVSLGLF